MSTQFEQHELLLKQLLKTNQKVRKLIDEENFNDAIQEEARNTQLIEKINIQKRSIKLTEEEQVKVNELREQIKTIEKDNLELLKKLQADVKVKLQQAKSQEKFYNKYEQVEGISGSICDYSE